MNQFNLGWIPLIQQELRKFFASKGQGDKADTALQPGAIGTTVQGYDADLNAIAALTTTGLIDRTGAGTAAIRPTGATGLAVLASADAAAARTAIAVPPINNPSFTGVIESTGYIRVLDITDGTAQRVIEIDITGTTASRRGLWQQYTSGVGTSSVIILSDAASRAFNGGLALVRGRLASSPEGTVFLDLVLHRGLSGITVIQSGTVIGSPAARTYGVIGSGNRELTLSMASGTYNIEVLYQM